MLLRAFLPCSRCDARLSESMSSTLKDAQTWTECLRCWTRQVFIFAESIAPTCENHPLSVCPLCCSCFTSLPHCLQCSAADWSQATCSWMIKPGARTWAQLSVCPSCRAFRVLHHGDWLSWSHWLCPSCFLRPEDVSSTGAWPPRSVSGVNELSSAAQH